VFSNGLMTFINYLLPFVVNKMRLEWCHGLHTNKTVRKERAPVNSDDHMNNPQPTPEKKFVYNVIRKSNHLGTCDKCSTRNCGDADPAQKKRPAKHKRHGHASCNLREIINEGWDIYYDSK
jgi:hypothetical protein